MSIEALMEDIAELTSLPQVAIKVNQMADDPNSSAADIGKIISQDPALTIRMLRIANSAYYGLSSEVETVARAVTLLGSKRIRDLVMATSVAEFFDGLPNELVSMKNFWLHSLYCALAAQYLAGQCKVKVQGDVVFVAGLLHDIGDLLIFNKMPDKSREALMYAVEGPEEMDVHLAEQEILGFDHAQVGAELAKKWQLPEVLLECIEFHHEPEKAEKFPVETAIVHIANSLAYLAELNSTDEYESPKISEIAWERTGLDRSVIVPTLEVTHEQIAEVQASFFPDQ